MSNQATLSVRGARVRGALVFLGNLEAEGRAVWGDGGTLRIRPAEGLHGEDVRFLQDFKPELLALLAFTREQREILARHDVDLQDLRRYRAGLAIWLKFSTREQQRLLGLSWTPEDLVALGQLRTETGGEIQSTDGLGIQEMVSSPQERDLSGEGALSLPHRLKDVSHGS